MASVGDALNDRFRLDRELGRGGFAVVYLATDLLLSSADRQRLVAVKVLHPELVAQIDERDFLARFKDEAGLIATLEHPNILGLYDYGEANGIPYFVMPYVSGGTLYDQIRGGRALGFAAIERYLRQAAAALDYAHRRNLVHRDIKPQNMLLREDGEQLLLADFGIAKMLSSVTTHSRTGIVGTVAYMAPEQFQGQVGIRSDIYALGCVLFQLLTGGLPFNGPTQQVMYGHIAGPIPSVVERGGGRAPAAAQAIIERALAKQPQDRFASAGELARAFAATIGSAADPAIPFSAFVPNQLPPQPTLDAPSLPPLPTTVDVPPPTPLSATVDAPPPTPMPTTESRVLQREPLTPTAPGEQSGDDGLALRYIEAVGAIERAEWERSIALLRPIVERSPDYREATTLLTRAEQQRHQSARSATLPDTSVARPVVDAPPPLPAYRTAPLPAYAPPIAAPSHNSPSRRGLRIGSLTLGAGALGGIAALCIGSAIALAAIIGPRPSPTATAAPTSRPSVGAVGSTAPATTMPTMKPTSTLTPTPITPTATGVTPPSGGGSGPSSNPASSNSPRPVATPVRTTCYPSGSAPQVVFANTGMATPLPSPARSPSASRSPSPSRSPSTNAKTCLLKVARTGVEGLALRAMPRLDSDNLAVVPDNTRLEQSGPDFFENGFWWRRVRYQSREVYVRAEFTDPLE